LIDAQCLDGRYLYYLLVSRAVTAQLESRMVGSTFNRINVADIKGVGITWPPPVEQAVIAQYLDEATAHLDRQELLAWQTIDRLIEYRSTLITSAVTGRIDVRHAA
jgi:type I restriction enzyme, S subunit